MKKYLLSILCAFLLLSGCDYLDMVPEKDIETVESIFEQKAKAEVWWKTLYSDLNLTLVDICANISYMGSDEFVTCQALYNSTLYGLDGLRVADGQQMSQTPVWFYMVQDVHDHTKL